MNAAICPVCGTPGKGPFFEMDSVPAFCNVLWKTAEAARSADRGRITLEFCEACGHVWNASFQPELVEYAENYENSLHYSPRFQSYVEELAKELITEFDVHGKDVVDIGCGQGDFLKMICESGDNRGLGFDPSYRGEDQSPDGRTRFIRDFYSKEYIGEKADLVCCRHVLEHIPQPAEFLRSIRQTLENKPDTVVFFEVPNVLWTLRDLGIWDIIYEHVSYFSPRSISSLFSQCGFEVIRTWETYNGQFLCIVARPSQASEQPASRGDAGLDLSGMVSAFSDRYREKRDNFIQLAGQMKSANKRGVIWGAGSKGVTLLNAIDLSGVIQHVVDINPRKHGMHVAGTGQQIVPPEFLAEYRPDVVCIMNPEYVKEISGTLEAMQLNPELVMA